jgi:hypothetical protein
VFDATRWPFFGWSSLTCHGRSGRPMLAHALKIVAWWGILAQ